MGQEKEEVDKVEEEEKYEIAKENVYCSALGELWKFNAKREEFKILMDDVEALLVEHDSEDFVCSFQIVSKKMVRCYSARRYAMNYRFNTTKSIIRWSLRCTMSVRTA